MYTIEKRPVLSANVCLARLLAVIAGALVAAAPAAAQGTRTGSIEGRVTDSVHVAPLTGATVQAVRLTPEPHVLLTVVADREGRFQFDSLAGGRYAISFSSPLLDSLDLVIPDRSVELDEGGRRTVDLALPSGATLRAAACPGLHLPDGQGAVVGSVTDAANEHALRDAMVVVGWNELIVEKTPLSTRVQPRTGAVRTDSLGRYRLCGVPTDQLLNIQVQHTGGSGGVVELMVNDSIGVVRRDISYADEPVPPAAGGDTDTVKVARLPAETGTASVTGVVLGPQDRPLQDVELRVTGARGSARSDAAGRFSLSGLPAGTRMLEARRIGYSMNRVPVELRNDRVVQQTIRLVHIVSLDSIRIVAQRSRYPDFERHRKSGWGRFLDETDIVRRNPFNTSDLLRMMPGFRVARNGFDTVVLSGRGGMFGGGGCRVNIVIDGMQNMEIDMVHPSDIAAMETYSSIAGVPPEYASNSHCGAVIIWTKR